MKGEGQMCQNLKGEVTQHNTVLGQVHIWEYPLKENKSVKPIGSFYTQYYTTQY